MWVRFFMLQRNMKIVIPVKRVYQPSDVALQHSGWSPLAATHRRKTAMKTQDFTAFSQDAIAASQTFAKAMEAFGREWMAAAQTSFGISQQGIKALAGAKTIPEAIAIQQDLARASYDNFVANSAKFSEMGTKMLTDAFAPLATATGAKLVKPAKLAA
jgi:hypothetical protein